MAGDAFSEKPLENRHTRDLSNGGISSSDSNLSLMAKRKIEGHANAVDSDTIQRSQSKDAKVDVGEKKEEDDPYSHLPAHEGEILKRQVFVPEVKVGFTTLYRYATAWDLTIILISCVCSIVAGAVLPLMTVRYSASISPARVLIVIKSGYLWSACRGISRPPSHSYSHCLPIHAQAESLRSVLHLPLHWRIRKSNSVHLKKIVC